VSSKSIEGIARIQGNTLREDWRFLLHPDGMLFLPDEEPRRRYDSGILLSEICEKTNCNYEQLKAAIDRGASVHNPKESISVIVVAARENANRKTIELLLQEYGLGSCSMVESAVNIYKRNKNRNNQSLKYLQKQEEMCNEGEQPEGDICSYDHFGDDPLCW
jgi:hypothetical protein